MRVDRSENPLRRLSSAIVLALIGFPGTLLAQTPPPCCPGPECPNGRTIRVVVPFAPGSPADIVARKLALALQNRAGSPYIVENRTGAGGMVGADFVAKSNWMDTILVTNSQLTVSAALLLDAPYRIGRDLLPVAGVSSSPTVLVVPADSAVKNLKDFIALAKAKSGGLTVGTPGAATISHLALAQLSEVGGVKLMHVPYKGTGPTVVDVVGGRLDGAVLPLASVQPLSQSGKVRLLAVFSEQRLKTSPELPTVAEVTGQPVAAEDRVGVFAASGTPPECTKSLGRFINRVSQEPQFRDALVQMGLVPAPADSDVFAAIVKSDASRWAKVANQAGIKIE